MIKKRKRFQQNCLRPWDPCYATINLEAEDINNPMLDPILDILQKHIKGFSVTFGNSNYFTLHIPYEEVTLCIEDQEDLENDQTSKNSTACTTTKVNQSKISLPFGE